MKTMVTLLAVIGFAAYCSAALAQDCDVGTTWDEATETCVPDES